MDFLPHFDSATASRSVHHFKDFRLREKSYAPIVGRIINSTLFYIWFISYGNGRNVALRDIVTFPAPASLFEEGNMPEFKRLFTRLMSIMTNILWLNVGLRGLSIRSFIRRTRSHS